FGLDFEKISMPPIEKSTKPLIGINLCPAIFGDKTDYLKKIDNYLLPFINKMQDKADFVFIPGKEDDIALIDKLNSKVEMSNFTPDPNNYFESYFKIIKKCDTIIAARYHILFLAMILGKPTYALSYSEKTQSLLEDYKNFVKPVSNIGEACEKIGEERLQSMYESVNYIFANIS
ncbi:hypothetical protein GF354_03835, partial [Candidatus Peregrinibacteria bacterium]|nr:hypothetical protein [Candidatus Peregrinibacteria bacterium]